MSKLKKFFGDFLFLLMLRHRRKDNLIKEPVQVRSQRIAVHMSPLEPFVNTGPGHKEGRIINGR
jgi:hypothetical protein